MSINKQTYNTDSVYSDNTYSVYSDTLFFWNPDKYNACSISVWGNEGQGFQDRKPHDIEIFLSMYLEKPVKLLGVYEQRDVNSGYPVWIFKYHY
jgi:hypothetical protein